MTRSVSHRLPRAKGRLPEAIAVPEAWGVPGSRPIPISRPIPGPRPVPVAWAVPAAEASPAAKAIPPAAARRLSEPLLHGPARARPEARAGDAWAHASASPPRVPVAQALVDLRANTCLAGTNHQGPIGWPAPSSPQSRKPAASVNVLHD